MTYTVKTNRNNIATLKKIVAGILSADNKYAISCKGARGAVVINIGSDNDMTDIDYETITDILEMHAEKARKNAMARALSEKNAHDGQKIREMWDDIAVYTSAIPTDIVSYTDSDGIEHKYRVYVADNDHMNDYVMILNCINIGTLIAKSRRRNDYSKHWEKRARRLSRACMTLCNEYTQYSNVNGRGKRVDYRARVLEILSEINDCDAQDIIDIVCNVFVIYSNYNDMGATVYNAYETVKSYLDMVKKNYDNTVLCSDDDIVKLSIYMAGMDNDDIDSIGDMGIKTIVNNILESGYTTYNKKTNNSAWVYNFPDDVKTAIRMYGREKLISYDINTLQHKRAHDIKAVRGGMSTRDICEVCGISKGTFDRKLKLFRELIIDNVKRYEHKDRDKSLISYSNYNEARDGIMTEKITDTLYTADIKTAGAWYDDKEHRKHNTPQYIARYYENGGRYDIKYQIM